MNKHTLAIDDARELSFAHILARTYHDGINALKHLGPWDELYLDHDLGAVQPQFTDSGIELTGYHICEFLEEHPEYRPKQVFIVSSNPGGRQRMKVVLDKIYSNVTQCKCLSTIVCLKEECGCNCHYKVEGKEVVQL